MYHRAEICLPRKKKVLDSYRSNTFRVFDENIPERLKPDEVYRDHNYAARDAGETELLKTHNIPHPCNAKFIRTNVRFLNEPVAHMETESTVAEQFHWCSNSLDRDVARKTVYSKDSTQRRDYQAITCTPVVRFKEGRNRPPATGIIPTLSPLGQPKILVEHMSFIHQYDSRRLQDQPYQGKRHGAFVWTERGVRGPGTFQSVEGLNSSQHAPLSLPSADV
ncbi:uncharacterized protein C2orf73 homolog isoform X1 [Pygocentrus nattereri]|uniref:Uncharacterized protein n=1 Tax=Pygocentrus nattereri TaxID=42514 RepID=A0A3B4BR52_PYGNA|nr:uncharacterized protein C2orf73 homolog isoform X1 [Pygocentrus nattereri]